MRRLPCRLLASTPQAIPRGIALPLPDVHRLPSVGPRLRRPVKWRHCQSVPSSSLLILQLPSSSKIQVKQQQQQQQRALFFSTSSRQLRDSTPSDEPPSQTHTDTTTTTTTTTGTTTTSVTPDPKTSSTPPPPSPSLSQDGDDKTKPAKKNSLKEAARATVASAGDFDPAAFPRLPFRFETGIGLFAKRTPRPFPPPFLSPPSGSFSDPLSTHNRSRDRRQAYVDGHLIRGYTNGDDAVFASEYFICANDGVGAWSTRPRGHAGLWARLILHFWATAMSQDAARQGDAYQPDPVAYLQRAYEQTLEATTSAPNDWQGTTTATGAQLHYRRRQKQAADDDKTDSAANNNGEFEPLLYVTNLGDSQVMVVRPSARKMIFKSTEQWHWFDCPRQLGTNSPDTPATCAVVDEVPIQEGDVVLAMSDGVIDNLWSHEIVEKVSESLDKWQAGEVRRKAKIVAEAEAELDREDGGSAMMEFVAEELMEAAKVIALDPYAESPFMEHAIEEGLASEGGKLDDISVVAGMCVKQKQEG